MPPEPSALWHCTHLEANIFFPAAGSPLDGPVMPLLAVAVESACAGAAAARKEPAARAIAPITSSAAPQRRVVERVIGVLSTAGRGMRWDPSLRARRRRGQTVEAAGQDS